MKRLKEIFYLVEADSYAQLCLWKEFHTKLDWKQDNQRLFVHVGEFHKRPVNLVITFSMLNGKRIACWEPVSSVVNYEMISKWFDANCKAERTDACNFHNVWHALQEA